MCTPAVAIAMTAVSTAVQYAGAQQQAAAAESQADYNAQVARNNAAIAQQQAAQARSRGADNEAAHRQRVSRVLAEQRVAAADAGLDVGYGAPVVLGEDTRHMGELDALTIRENAAQEAWGHEVGAMNLNADARLETMAGKNRAAAARAKGTSSLLAGAGRVASQWNTYYG